MKKLLSVSVAVLLLLTCIPLGAISVSAATSGYFTYAVSNGVATITDFDASYSGSVSIPSYLDGYSVTRIGSSAFDGCTGITELTIPSSVTSIGSRAFRGCIGIAELTIPSSVTEIDSYLFANCTGLTTLNYNTNADTSPYGVGLDLFTGCTKLTTVNIGYGVRFIGYKLFEDVSSIKTVNISNTVTTIGTSAFEGCTGITELTIPSSVKSIRSNAFRGCIGIAELTIPSSVTELQYDLFANCTGLTTLNYNTNADTSPYGVGLDLFTGCTKLTTVNIGYGVRFIGYKLFEDVSSIKTVNISNTVTTIGTSAFKGCSGITQVTYCGDSNSWTNITIGSNNESLTNVPRSYHNYQAATCTKPKTCSLCGGTSGSALGHSWKAANCTTPKTCSRCKLTEGGIAHSWVAATCEEMKHCTACGLAEGNPLGHNIVSYEAKQPTCDQVGWYAYEACTRCDKSTYVEIPANGHSYKAVVTAPTCTEQGYTTHTCSTCGNRIVDTYVSATGHSYGDWNVTNDPTCTVKGEKRRDCNHCDHYETAEVAVLGHDLIRHTMQAPTCTEIGWDTYETCSRCDYTTYVEIPANGHTYRSVVTSPTCTESGYTTYTCRCGDSYIDSYVPAKDHNYRTAVVDPTCTEQGYSVHTCLTCGDNYKDAYVSAYGHEYDIWYYTIVPTCLENGIQRHDCIHCNYYETEEVATSGHKLTQNNAQAPTCTDVGWEAYEICSRCDYNTYVEIPATGHEYESVVTDPTCTEQGYTTHTCHCGDSYVDTYVKAKGHNYSAATCTKAKTCKICGVTSGSKLGHTYEKKTTKATLTKDGVIKNVCSKCGYTASKTTTIYKASSVKLSKTSYTYNGKVQKPTVIVKDSKGKTISSSNYTVTYASGMKNAGTYKVTVKMKGNYSGTKTLTYKINPVSVSKCKFSLSATSYTYNGSAKKPAVTVKNASSTKLTTSSYTVTYATGRKNVGKYKVTIKMKGNYSGTKTLYFKINPPKTTVKSLTAGSKKLTVNITKKSTQVTGYQIQYSTSKSFKSYKTKNVTSYKTTKATLTGLKAKTTYYVRIRTYKTVNGVKYYSGWSEVKYKKTK